MEQTETSDVIEVVKLDILNLRTERMHCKAAIGRYEKLASLRPIVADVMASKAKQKEQYKAELSGKIEALENLLVYLEKITP
jgi:hypothetical protein